MLLNHRRVTCLPFCFALRSLEYPARHHNRNHPRSVLWSSINMASSSLTSEKKSPRVHYSLFNNVIKEEDDNDNDNEYSKGVDCSFDPSTTAMIVLNSPIRRPPSPLFEKLWAASSMKICADGGANRLYHATTTTTGTTAKKEDMDTSTRPPQQRRDDEGAGPTVYYRPDLITGDLDSLHPQTREYYEQRLGVQIVRQYDQNYNDLDKSIRSIPKHYRTCLVYGAFGGRMDQEMAAVQALFTYLDTIPQIWLFDDQNAAILLGPGEEHHIYCPNYRDAADATELAPGQGYERRVLGEGPTCGLIPIGEPCQSVTTRGLQWNLHGDPLAFGRLVSTSNRIVERCVTVQCSHPLLFTVEVYAGIENEEAW